MLAKDLEKYSLSQLACLASVEIDEPNMVRVFRCLLDLIPMAAWIKRLENINGHPVGRMLFINSAYSKQWEISKDRYEGRLDSEVWGSRVADEFAQNDLEAISRMPNVYKTSEEVPGRAFSDSCQSTANPRKIPVWLIGKRGIKSSGSLFVLGIAFNAKAIPGTLEEYRNGR